MPGTRSQSEMGRFGQTDPRVRPTIRRWWRRRLLPIRSPASLSTTTRCRPRVPVVDRLSDHPRGFNGPVYARSWMRISENLPSPNLFGRLRSDDLR